jgi:hypothetical protein
MFHKNIIDNNGTIEQNNCNCLLFVRGVGGVCIEQAQCVCVSVCMCVFPIPIPIAPFKYRIDLKGYSHVGVKINMC